MARSAQAHFHCLGSIQSTLFEAQVTSHSFSLPRNLNVQSSPKPTMVLTRTAKKMQQSQAGGDVDVGRDLDFISHEIDTQSNDLGQLSENLYVRTDVEDRYLDELSLQGDRISDALDRLHNRVDHVGNFPEWRAMRYDELDEAREMYSDVEDRLHSLRVPRHRARLQRRQQRTPSPQAHAVDALVEDLEGIQLDASDADSSGTVHEFWKTKAEVLERHRESLLKTFDVFKRHLDYKKTGVGKVIAFDCEFSPGKAQYAHIPWQIAAVDMSTTKAKVQAVTAYWNYGEDSNAVKNDIQDKVDAVDDEKMEAWLRKQAGTYSKRKTQQNMANGLTANEIQEEFRAAGINEHVLLITWGTTNADACAFAKIWAGNDDLLVETKDLDWERYIKLDVSQLIKKTSHLGNLSLKEAYMALFPDAPELDWHDALADATATANIASHIYENRHRWL
ncbi:hypothetical protein P171DRAFT_449838 [Karstenula rhodostoma CBS 690.94]|uniref:Uncharacterized protein n=1 Tax=Karstenula rhodostoma CBS 690.94 TaxID=1392251 RepID=A0A9P4U529_9PLEO|nr:hypothetical protein P171DRAFT_449838 [Karstenula rhodostoma CBS 690.94]